MYMFSLTISDGAHTNSNCTRYLSILHFLHIPRTCHFCTGDTPSARICMFLPFVCRSTCYKYHSKIVPKLTCTSHLSVFSLLVYGQNRDTSQCSLFFPFFELLLLRWPSSLILYFRDCALLYVLLFHVS